MIKIFIITTQRKISDERHDHNIKQIDNCNQENQLFIKFSFVKQKELRNIADLNKLHTFLCRVIIEFSMHEQHILLSLYDTVNARESARQDVNCRA